MSDTSSNSEDWRKKGESLSEQLWHMYEKKLCYNLEVRVSVDTDFNVDENCKHYQCHQAVMARVCPDFEKKITAHLNSAKSEVCIIEIPNFTPEYFYHVIRYAYTDKPALKLMSAALAVLQWSHDHKARSLKHLCVDYISNHVDEHSVWDILDSDMKSVQVTAWAKSYLGQHTSECLRSANFLKCTRQTLEDVLKMQRLNVSSELELVQAVLRWLRESFNSSDSKEPLEVAQVQQRLGGALHHIRFMALTAPEFSQHVTTSGLLSNNDCLSVLVNLSSPGQMPLPESLCKITQPRDKAVQGTKTKPPTEKVAVLQSGEQESKKQCLAPAKKDEPVVEKKEEPVVVKKEEPLQPKESNAQPKKETDRVQEKIEISSPKKEELAQPSKENDEEKKENVCEEKENVPEKQNQINGCNNLIEHKGSVVNFIRPVHLLRSAEVSTPQNYKTTFKVSKAAVLKGVYLNPGLRSSSDAASSSDYEENLSVRVSGSDGVVSEERFVENVPFGPHKSFRVSFSNPGRLETNVEYEMQIIFETSRVYKNYAVRNEVYESDAKVTFIDGKSKEGTSFVLGLALSFS